VKARLAQCCPLIDHVDLAGDARRYSPLVTNLVIVARAADPERAVQAIDDLPDSGGVSFRTSRRALLTFKKQEIDLRIAPPDEFGTVLFASTGPAEHVAAVLSRRGPHLSASEAGVYEHAGLNYLTPELRDRPDALQLAAQPVASPLIARRDIRGDLHMHTNSSDGSDSLDAMVTAAAALGYEYIAITDHSEHSAASRSITLDELEKQHEEIQALRARRPGMAILHGIEVDILADGSLDCPDDMLARLDIVLASLHDSHGHSGARLTERCIRAIRHPLVSVITHPSNQLVGRRPGYDLDYDRIYREAAATGTLLEIDGAPSHLDLDSERARAAVLNGVMLTIDSDCHRATALERQMRFGVGTARRAGVMASQVANTRPLTELRLVLGRKRGPAC